MEVLNIQNDKYYLDYKIYKISELDNLLKSIDINNVRKKKKDCTYLNYAFSFDIETTSFYDDENEKCALMYAFVVGIKNKCIIGRTWEEFITICKRISNYCHLSKEKRIIIYVHNLSFEFQFMRKRFKWLSIFATDTHEPLTALCNLGIEFRCSYRLSGYSLSKVAENLKHYKIKKLVGDLDYKLIRNDKTPLTNEEMNYILNDGLIVLAYINEEIEEHKNNIALIELTKTGKVRTLCKDYCLFDNASNHHTPKANIQFNKNKHIIKPLTLNRDEYSQLKRAFMGGFTHANHNYVREVVDDVHSYDFSSAYPSVMLLNQYPMSKPKKIILKSEEEFKRYLNLYCCLFDIVISDIKAITNFEHYISISKCYICEKPKVDNGRLISAKRIALTITEQDFFIIEKMYEWSEINILNFRVFKKGYLPIKFIEVILKLYETKTILKGVEGKEVEYMNSKENLNSLYGMSVTDISHEEIKYENDEWIKSDTDTLDKDLDHYNNDKTRYLFYAWGVWVTAYNRTNLFKAIFELKNDYIYSDTDSVKFINYEKHKAFFDNYNKNIDEKIKYVSDMFKLDINKFKPKTKNGVTKTIGYFDYEGKYAKFKTLGAKRYLVKEGEELKITTSGLSKQTAMNYLKMISKNEDEIFKLFDNNLYIPKGYTGKMIHTYIEIERSGTIIDYLGNGSMYNELSSVHLEECDYSLSLTTEYLNYLLHEREDYY